MAIPLQSCFPKHPSSLAMGPFIDIHPAWLWKRMSGGALWPGTKKLNLIACGTSVQLLDRLQLFPQPRLYKAPSPGASSPTGPTLPAPPPLSLGQELVMGTDGG